VGALIPTRNLLCYNRRGVYHRLMRFFALSALLLPVLLLAPARAETIPDTSSPVETESPSKLDELYLSLKTEHSEVAANRIVSTINKELGKSGGATADLLIEWGQKAAKDKNYAVANDLMDQAIGLYPDYVEAWNSRAMLHLMMNNYSMAISDLSHALTIEPRHFGSLNGLAGILRLTGKQTMALDVYRRLLEVYPMHRGAQRAFIQLTEENTDEAL